MNKGIYIALSGAVQKSRQMDVLAQNMANANTNGYKKGRLSFKDYLMPTNSVPHVENQVRVMTEMSKEAIDFSNGAHKRTGNQLDVAINGEGFFALEGNRYTRNGNFSVNGEGDLIDSSGNKVLGDGGALTIAGSQVDITSTGEILVDQISVGSLKIVDFPDKSVLSKMEGGVFTTEEAGQQVDAVVSQGYLEQSNVNVVRELVDMIRTQREFESYQKMIRQIDETTGKTISDL